MKIALEIHPAEHEGYVVVQCSEEYNREYNMSALLFAGTLAAALEFINAFYTKRNADDRQSGGAGGASATSGAVDTA